MLRVPWTPYEVGLLGLLMENAQRNVNPQTGQLLEMFPGSFAPVVIGRPVVDEGKRLGFAPVLQVADSERPYGFPGQTRFEPPEDIRPFLPEIRRRVLIQRNLSEERARQAALDDAALFRQILQQKLQQGF